MAEVKLLAAILWLTLAGVAVSRPVDVHTEAAISLGRTRAVKPSAFATTITPSPDYKELL
jgi:hypothetical protein